MKLRKPCVHDRYERHATYIATDGTEKFIPWHVVAESPVANVGECPGGVFLPDDTLVIEIEDFDGRRFWPNWALDSLQAVLDKKGGFLYPEEVLDALSVREAE